MTARKTGDVPDGGPGEAPFLSAVEAAEPVEMELSDMAKNYTINNPITASLALLEAYKKIRDIMPYSVDEDEKDIEQWVELVETYFDSENSRHSETGGNEEFAEFRRNLVDEVVDIAKSDFGLYIIKNVTSMLQAEEVHDIPQYKNFRSNFLRLCLFHASRYNQQ